MSNLFPLASNFTMRKPCKCGCPDGTIEVRGGQDCVFCINCRSFQYNAPRTETGREQRSISTTHDAVGPKVRARILTRDHFMCTMCHATDRYLHVGHLLSVESAHRLHEEGWLSKPLTDQQINSDDNLAAMCETCNLGMGKEPIPVYLLAAVLLARLRIAEKP